VKAAVTDVTIIEDAVTVRVQIKARAPGQKAAHGGGRGAASRAQITD
jgi:hypothetical protein